MVDATTPTAATNGTAAPAPVDSARPSLASRRISYDSNVQVKTGLAHTLSLGPLPDGAIAPQTQQALPTGQRSVPAREPSNAFAQTVSDDVVTPGATPASVAWATNDKSAQLWNEAVESPKKAVGQDLSNGTLPRSASFASTLDYRRGSDTTGSPSIPTSSNPATSPASSHSRDGGSSLYSSPALSGAGSPRRGHSSSALNNGGNDLDALSSGFRNMRVASSPQQPNWGVPPQPAGRGQYDQGYIGGFYGQNQPELIAAAAAAAANGAGPYYDAYTWAANPAQGSPALYQQPNQGNIRRAPSTTWQVGGLPAIGLGLDRTPSRSPVQQYSPTLSRGYGYPDPYAGAMVDYGRGNMAATGMIGGGMVSPYAYTSGPINPLLAGASGPMGALRVMRSPLLEDFRANRHRRWDLDDLRGHICEFANDQLGSRHIQTKLETCSAEERVMVFQEIMPTVLSLSTDTFGNYVCQKLFEVANQEQKLALVEAFRGNVLRLSLQSYACRVVQKAIEQVNLEHQVQLVQELADHVLKCARDQNANHTLQKIVSCMPSEKIGFIAEACTGQVFALATHPYGCRVLQRILENMRDIQPLIDELLRYSQNLIQDQYGNYLAQHLLEHGSPAARSAIIARVRGQILHLSRHKFASNVVDKAILCATDEERSVLCDEVLADPAGVGMMLRDPFANYPLQKLLLTIQGQQREILLARTRDALEQLKRYSSGGQGISKHLSAIEKWILNAS